MTMFKYIKASPAAAKVGTGLARLGGVVGAAAYGAHKIRKASKAASKEIESIHSPARNIAHNKMLAAIKSSGKRKRTAAAKLRKVTKKPLHKPVQPGSISSPGYDYKKWR